MRSSPVVFCLKEYINHLAILVYGSPQVMLFSVDLDEDLIDEERITEAPVLSFQSSSV